MECAYEGLSLCVIQAGSHALSHLLRRLIGKGDGKDVLVSNAAFNEVDNAVCERLGFSGPGPGNNQERPFGNGDCLFLFLVQFFSCTHRSFSIYYIICQSPSLPNRSPQSSWKSPAPLNRADALTDKLYGELKQHGLIS